MGKSSEELRDSLPDVVSWWKVHNYQQKTKKERKRKTYVGSSGLGTSCLVSFHSFLEVPWDGIAPRVSASGTGLARPVVAVPRSRTKGVVLRTRCCYSVTQDSGTDVWTGGVETPQRKEPVRVGCFF